MILPEIHQRTVRREEAEGPPDFRLAPGDYVEREVDPTRRVVVYQVHRQPRVGAAEVYLCCCASEWALDEARRLDYDDGRPGTVELRCPSCDARLAIVEAPARR